MRTILKTVVASTATASSIQIIRAYRTPPNQLQPVWAKSGLEGQSLDPVQLVTHSASAAAVPQACSPSCNQTNRCLAHCWMDDSQREQGQRCLVGCWQTNHHLCQASLAGQIAPNLSGRSSNSLLLDDAAHAEPKIWNTKRLRRVKGQPARAVSKLISLKPGNSCNSRFDPA